MQIIMISIIVAEVESAMDEYTRIRASLAGQQQCRREGDSNHHLNWKAPPLGWYKANADVAIDRAAGRYAIGVVVRDAEGNCIAARCATQKGLVSPVAGEALALYHAACLGVELGGTKIILEGDSIQVINAMNSEEQLWSNFGHLVEDTKYAMRNVPGWKCNHVSRDANGAAHNLAKAAVKNGFDYTWMGDAPDCIRDVISKECQALSFH
jgi:hypothetical protein